MKTTLTTIAALALIILSSTPQAEARGHRTTVYVSSHLACGTPVYRERYCSGYDRRGNAVWASRPHRVVQHPTRRPAYRPVTRRAYVPPCPPPRHAAPYRRGDFEARVVYSR